MEVSEYIHDNNNSMFAITREPIYISSILANSEDASERITWI
jgi:hypothetical protein